MLTEKDYCDYDTCVALKELGYNRGAYAYYFPNHKEDLLFNTHPMRGCSINEMVRGYNTYSDDIVGHELIDAPILYEAQKWLREEKKLVVLVGFDFCPITSEIEYNWVIVVNGNTAKKSSFAYDYFEEAFSEGIKVAVKILKDGNNN